MEFSENTLLIPTGTEELSAEFNKIRDLVVELSLFLNEIIMSGYESLFISPTLIIFSSLMLEFCIISYLSYLLKFTIIWF